MDNIKNPMKLRLDFDELMHAFETCNVVNHWFIDKEKNELININEEIDDDTEEKLEKIDDEKYITLPERMPSDDFSIIELFIYDIVEEDFNLADEFYQVLDKPKPFRRFKDLLEKYPEIKEKWFKFKDNYIKNELINLLFEKNIVLEGQKLILQIEIRELNISEFNMLPEEWRDFSPFGCMKCKNQTGIKARIFLVNIDIENSLIDDEVKKIMKEKYNINDYGVLASDKIFLTAAKCFECGSESIFWDF